jgi:CRISPR-associated protein Csm4
MYLVELHLRPGTQFHLGSQVSFDKAVLHDTDSNIHSDTLFAAIVNISAKIGYEEQIVDELENRNFISSAYYFLEYGNNRPLYFLPRPTVPILENANYKKIKSIAYVSKGIFENEIPVNQWFDSTKMIWGNNWIATIDEMQTLLGDMYNDGRVEQIRLFDKVNIPQVQVHANQNEDNYYQVGNLQIADNLDLFRGLKVHFYFLLKHEPSDELKTVFNLLQHEGIGGQRSTGCGQVVDVKIFESKTFEGLKGDSRMALSKVIPTTNDIQLIGQNSFYQTTIRGGRLVDNPRQIRLKQVCMIDEGAVFERDITGSIVDLRPDASQMPFLRYGKAFLINLSKNLSYA